jgi:hypothetical protein
VATLEELHRELMAAAQRAAAPQLAAIEALRRALDMLEASLRREAEAQLVRRAAEGAGLALMEEPTEEDAAAPVVAAARALIALLGDAAPSDDDAAAPDTTAPDTAAADTAATAAAATAAANAVEADTVEPPDSAAEEPQAKPVTPAQLRAWLETGPPSSQRESRPQLDPHLERQALRLLLERVGEPPVGTSEIELIDELDRLDDISVDENLERWHKLARTTQRTWLAQLVSRGRAVREAVMHSPSMRQRVREILVRFPTFASSVQPGFINGMSPDHGPVGESWRADAMVHLEDLRAIAGLQRPGAKAEGLRAASSRRPKKPRERSSEPGIEVPAHIRARLADMRVLLFGGTPREDARANLEQSFGMSSLQWPESAKPRRLDAIIASVARGSYDLILVTRLVHHHESGRLVDAARSADVPFAFIETGYGVAAVQRAIESALDLGDGDSGAAAGAGE